MNLDGPFYGEMVYLNRLTEVTDTYLKWLHDEAVIRYLQVRFQPRDRASVQAYVKSFDHQFRFLFGIYTKRTAQHIGNISLRVNPVHRFAHMGYMIGYKPYWGTPATLDACRVLLQFAFERAGVRMIFECTTTDHRASNFNFRRLGFTHAATIPDLYLGQNGYVGATYWTLSAEQWKASRHDPSDSGGRGSAYYATSGHPVATTSTGPMPLQSQASADRVGARVVPE